MRNEGNAKNKISKAKISLGHVELGELSDKGDIERQTARTKHRRPCLIDHVEADRSRTAEKSTQVKSGVCSFKNCPFKVTSRIKTMLKMCHKAILEFERC